MLPPPGSSMRRPRTGGHRNLRGRQGADALWAWMRAPYAHGCGQRAVCWEWRCTSSRLLDDPSPTATRQLLVRVRVTRSQVGVVIIGHGSPPAVCGRRCGRVERAHAREKHVVLLVDVLVQILLQRPQRLQQRPVRATQCAVRAVIAR
jgi:hypothetical protein